mmetsp:Transcript_7634/g.15537  ORF Transcript_7634/g.15537 Transcript_7634/m.15537 type:complete len:582 (-) Transcript_7634:83-1828(-)|eukprot:CAMPEP_0118945886 /NCGR_PEP_ID=MMETSP1169-20130426/43187_1 /TAXON_ID=36882 /ORGANISM="Pyramimonas obovata, Strain CCMP722" /LENGTH=581 /DNA_ID=CAMNT_0006891715 /DNA_START=81 /DNA_END=1826 /DNA_ORIENTATION=+
MWLGVRERVRSRNNLLAEAFSTKGFGKVHLLISVVILVAYFSWISSSPPAPAPNRWVNQDPRFKLPEPIDPDSPDNEWFLNVPTQYNPDSKYLGGAGVTTRSPARAKPGKTVGNPKKADDDGLCVSKTFDKQPFYGTANVYSRKGSLKIEELWNDKVPNIRLRSEARSLQICNLSAPENAQAVLASKSLDKTQSYLAAASGLLADPSQLEDPKAALERAFPGTQDASKQWAPDTPTCSKKVNLAFFMTSQVGAPLIRGFMTADFVKESGHGGIAVLAKRGAWNPTPLKEFQSCKRIDACIFIKWYNRAFPSLVKECRARGAAVFVDFIDYCNTHIKNVIDRFPQQVTGFITQSAWQAEYFRALDYPRSIMLQHPQTNFNNRHNTGERDVTTIGYTGHWRNLGAANQKLFDQIAEWGKPRGIEFKSIDYYKFNNVQKGTVDVFKQAIYHEAIDDVDVAIIWPQAEDDDMEIYFKPVTRLIYWLSHGIPCIFYPTQSYAEFSQDLGYPLVAKTTDDVMKWLEILKDNKEFRMHVSALGLRGAQQRSAKSTANLYINEMCKYAENKTKAEFSAERITSYYASPK